MCTYKEELKNHYVCFGLSTEMSTPGRLIKSYLYYHIHPCYIQSASHGGMKILCGKDTWREQGETQVETVFWLEDPLLRRFLSSMFSYPESRGILYQILFSRDEGHGVLVAYTT